MKVLFRALFFLLGFFSCFVLLGQNLIKQIGPDFAYFPQEACFANNGRIFLSTQGGIYSIDNNSSHWRKVNESFNGIYFNNASFIKGKDGSIYAWDSNGFHGSSNNGVIWDDWFYFFPSPAYSNYQSNSFAIQGDTLFAAITKGLGYTVKGNFLATPFSQLADKNIVHVEVSGNSILAFGSDSKLFATNDRGTSWTNYSDIPFSVANSYGYQIDRKGNTLLAATNEGVWISIDFGKSWKQKNLNLPSPLISISDIQIDGEEVFIAVNQKYFCKSTLDNASWQTVFTSVPYHYISFISIQGNDAIFGGNQSLFRSIDRGVNWTPMSIIGIHDSYINFLYADNAGTVYASGPNTFSYKKKRNEPQFLPFKDGLSGEVSIEGDTIYAPVNSAGIVLFNSGSGSLIDRFTYSSNVLQPRKILHSGKQFFVSTNNNGVWNYTDQKTWVDYNSSLGSLTTYDFVLKDTLLFVSTDKGLYRTGIKKANWKLINNGSNSMSSVDCFAIQDSIIVTGSSYGDLRISKDSGVTWKLIGQADLIGGITDVIFVKSSLLVSTYSALFSSSDLGQNFKKIAINDTIKYSPFIMSMAATSDSIYVGTSENGIYTFSMDLLKVVPMINWNNPVDIIYGTTLSSTQLNATSSVEGTFSYTPASGTKLNAGSNQSLSVTFTPADAANYTSAVKQVTINVSKATPSLIWSNPADIICGTALSTTQLNATSLVDGTFSYTPISGTKLNAGSNQNLSATFTPADAANYTSATKQVTINVSKATPSITWSNPSDIVYGTTLSATQLNATSSVTGTFIYTPAINSKLNAGSAQQLSVTLSPTDDINYLTTTAKVSINVSKAQQQITFGSLPDKTIGDGSFTLAATVNSTLPLSYSTTSDKIGISSGVVSLLKPGRVDITANQSGNENYNAAASVSQSFCIKPIKPIITLSGLNTATPTLTSSASTGNQWYSGTTLLTGETNNTLVIKISGTYKVQVKADDCLSEFSLDQNLIITGDIPTTSDPLLAYPNPATSILTIDSGDEDGKKEVAIFDLLGRSILTQQNEGKKTEIDVSEYTRGLYIIKVQTTVRKSILRFEKQ